MAKPADPHVVAYIRDQVDRFGVRPTGIKFHLSDSTIVKLAAGIGVSRTVADVAKFRVERARGGKAA
jgi:hypothetical protein